MLKIFILVFLTIFSKICCIGLYIDNNCTNLYENINDNNCQSSFGGTIRNQNYSSFNLNSFGLLFFYRDNSCLKSFTSIVIGNACNNIKSYLLIVNNNNIDSVCSFCT